MLLVTWLPTWRELIVGGCGFVQPELWFGLATHGGQPGQSVVA